MKNNIQYQAIVRSMTEGVVLQAGDGSIVECNSSAERLLGLTQEQMMGRTSVDSRWQTVHEDGSVFPGQTHPAMVSLRTGLSQNNVIMGVQKPDGALTWISINSNPIFETDVHKPSSVVTTFTDITERMNAQDALRESETNFHMFFETMDDIIVVADCGGSILCANAAASKKLGYNAGELLSMRVLDLRQAQRRVEAETIFAAMMRGERDACSLPLVAKYGTLIPVETRIWPGRWNGADCIFWLSKDLLQEEEAQQRFERLFRNNPALMALSTLPERRFYDINDTFLKVLGYSKSEIIGKTTAEIGLFPEPDQQKAAAEILLTHGHISDFELRVRCKDGSFCDGLFSGEIIISRGVEYFLTVMIDITARKRAEEESKRQAEMISSLLDSIPDIVFFKDVGGVYLGGNPLFIEFVGRPKEEIVGMTDYELFDKVTADFFREQDRMMMEQGSPRHNEEWITYKDGSRKLIDTYKAPLIDVGGRVIGLLGISRDITERKRIEDLLRLRESCLSSIIENQPGLVWLKDAQGCFLAVNRAFAHSCGLESPDHVVGKTDFDVWPKELAEIYVADDAKVMASQKSLMTEERILDAGNYKWFETFKMPVFGDQGVCVGTTGYSRDITERKRCEEKIQTLNLELQRRVEESTEELAHVSRVAVLGQVTAAVAHELNQPLGSILNRASSAEMILSKPQPDISKLKKIVSRIIDDDERAANVIRKIRGLVKKDVIENEVLDMDELIHQVLDIMKSVAVLKGIKVELDLGLGAKQVLGDKTHLQQVLLNLIVNAMQAGSGSGNNKITIQSGIFSAGLATVSVSDCGPGIAESEIEKLFQPFYTTKKEGLGIGLFICRSIIQAHGGTLSAKNNPDRGAVFSFSLPITESCLSGSRADDAGRRIQTKDR